MTIPRFLQIHTLHSYSAALLNRDDSGLAKRLPYGGKVRTRISSQCLKRHWRTANDEFALHGIDGAEAALRSRDIVSRRIMESLEATGASEEMAKAIEDALNIGVYGDSGTSRSARQPLLLGLPEVEYLTEKAQAAFESNPEDPEAAAQEVKGLFIRRSEGPNFTAFRESARLPGGIEGALFGRMVTSDPAANIDAAIHVAHAFTVHAEESESDYFSVVDDLLTHDDDPGAAHIGDSELTAGLFYGYVVVDVPGLISNIEGCDSEDYESADRKLAGEVVRNLIHLIATVSPGAKLGSTAPYSYASMALVEAGNRQPRSLDNAYRKPSAPLTDDAVRAMSDYLGKLDAAYGVRETRKFMSIEDAELPGAERASLDEIAEWAESSIKNGLAG